MCKRDTLGIWSQVGAVASAVVDRTAPAFEFLILESVLDLTMTLLIII